MKSQENNMIEGENGKLKRIDHVKHRLIGIR